MRKITLTLASSLEEFKNERMHFADKIASWNDFYIDHMDTRVSLLKSESVDHSLSADGKQVELNELFKSCDMACFIIGKTVGGYTKEEFGVALQNFTENGTPKIYTYFKTLDAPDESVGQFRAELERIGHYYQLFSHISEVENDIKHSIDRYIIETNKTKRENEIEHITIADSTLVVVHSFIKGAEFEKVFPSAKVKYVTQKWGKSTLDYCNAGRAQFCIGNHNDVLKYLNENKNSKLKILGTIGHSMGGRNFSIIVRSDSSLIDKTLDEIKDNLAEHVILVGTNTDRFRGLLTVLGVDADWITEKEIKLIDNPDPELSIFDLNPNAIMVAGQNVRLQALNSNKYAELLPFTELDRETRRELLNNSENVLVSNSDFLTENKLDEYEIFQTLTNNFNALSRDFNAVDAFVDDLLDECELVIDDYDLREKLVRRALYETYRLGTPVV
ncbi:MAG: hypothetical protein LBL41_02830 [Bifidobacteriaceae bacterium]|jgi:hypothetical protein|nr:hypothetical protein [Bifidobacteriaceae bacterium]